MKTNHHTPDQFKSRASLAIMVVVGIILAYLLGSRALDTGSWWQYLGTLSLLILSLRLIVHGARVNK